MITGGSTNSGVENTEIFLFRHGRLGRYHRGMDERRKQQLRHTAGWTLITAAAIYFLVLIAAVVRDMIVDGYR